MIKRTVTTVTVDIIPTPKEMADIFWTYDEEQQVEFFHMLFETGPNDKNRRLQWNRISQSDLLTNQARQIMSEIGEAVF